MQASDYNDIGRYLKDSRESLRISVAQAAQAMHIRAHYIDALETGNLDVLPGKAYIRGYIKNYALFLGIDAEEALAAYDSLSVTAKRELYIPEPTVKENLPSRALLIIAVIAACFVVGYYAITRTGSLRFTSTVADVPSDLLLAAQAGKNKHNQEWLDCLNSQDPTCFNTMYSEDFLTEARHGYTDAFNLLTDNE